MKYKLEELCEFITDGTHQTPEYCEDGGVKFLSSKDVTARKIDWDNVKYIPESLHEKLYTRLSPRKDDILLAKNGTTGVAALVDRDEIFDVYVSLAVLRPKNIVYPKYLLYAINSSVAKRQFDAGLKGVGVPNLHLSVIRKTEINIEEYEKQLEVCGVLDKVVSIIDARKEELQQLDNLIKARFVELFGEWKSKPEPLKSFLEDITYGFTNPMPDAEEGPWKVTAKDVVNGRVNYDTARKTTVQAYEELTAKSKPAVGDVLLTKDGTLGRCAVVEEEGVCVNQSVAVLKCNKRILPNFLAILLQMPEYQREMLKNAGGGTIKHIYITKVVDMLIMVPTISQQLEFLSFVEQTDKSKVAVQKALDEAQLLFDSLMQKYFG